MIWSINRNTDQVWPPVNEYAAAYCTQSIITNACLFRFMRVQNRNKSAYSREQPAPHTSVSHHRALPSSPPLTLTSMPSSSHAPAMPWVGA